MNREREPIGVIVAGGAGRRIGGRKALAELHGAPLIGYPLAVLRASLADVAVIAKADTELPHLSGVRIWIEPERPRHPLVGIVASLELASPRPVLACAADLPFVTQALVARILATDPAGAPAVVPTCDGTAQPLLALYLPAALPSLFASARAADRSLRDAVAAIGPRLLQVHDSEAFFNVNTREDLVQAEQMLASRGRKRPTTRT